MNKISELIKKYWYVFLSLILLIGLVSISLIQKKEEERKIAAVMEQNQNAVLKLEKTDYDVNSILTLNLLKENLTIENLAEDTEVVYKIEEDKSLSEKDEIKLEKLGEFPITIDFNHEYGIVAKQIVLNIVDKESPIITGVKDLSTDYGKSIDYKNGIKVSDNYDEELKLKFEGDVDFEKAGKYKIAVSAIDSSGNKASEDFTVTVKEKVVEKPKPAPIPAPSNSNKPKPVIPTPGGTVSTNEDLINQVDKIIASITNDGMSSSQKVSAVYRWMKANVSYRAGPANGLSIEQNAINMLNRRRGQCEEYAGLAYVMMERMGIPVQYVKGEGQAAAGPGSYTYHTWVRVNTNGSYLHFDPLFGQRWPAHEFDQLSSKRVELLTSHRWNKSVYGN